MLVKGAKNLPRSIRSILLIQLGDLGDIVLSTPAMRAIHESLPKCRVTVVLREKARGLMEDCPWIHEAFYIHKEPRNPLKKLQYQLDFFSHLRRKRFELAIDMRTGTRGAILSYLSGARVRIGRYADDGKLWRNRLFTHLVRPENELLQHCAQHGLNILSPFGFQAEETSPALFVPPYKKDRIHAFLHKESIPSDDPIIAIQPFSLWHYKEWDIDHYVGLIQWIRERFVLPVLLIGSAEEKSRAAEIVKRCGRGVYNIAGKTPLELLPALLKVSSMLIGGDSAGIHIAAAVGTSTVSLFGPSSPVSWAPRGDMHQVIQKAWPCVPCRDKGCQNTEISRCLKELTLKEVRPIVERQILKLINDRNDT